MPIINSVIAGGGSPTPTGKYQLLQRVKDDSNNEIGTVCGFHTDANNVEYAIVCLDAQYRGLQSQYEYCSNANTVVTNLPVYANLDMYDSKDTATSNCTKILDFCTANNYYSTAVSQCRAQTFTINNIVYAGQLPTIAELLFIMMNRTDIDNLEPTSTPITKNSYWASTQNSDSKGWAVFGIGSVSSANKGLILSVIPILELPNA